MKKILKNLDRWTGALDRRWDRMPLERQHRLIRLFFWGYVLLTAAVITKVWLERSENRRITVTGHIDNPMDRQKKERYQAVQPK